MLSFPGGLAADSIVTLRGASAARGGSDLKSEGTVGTAAIKHIFLFFAARHQRDADFFASTAAEGGEGLDLQKGVVNDVLRSHQQPGAGALTVHLWQASAKERADGDAACRGFDGK
ncbi:MAG: hypothetical protein EOR30_06785 [Mesorhizobium sp.]|uniref:hypothetical protein n=1 Tax=Mesorhizobium sp. TaxID=1871066 RepID=UPI000FE9FDA2|nr:hypothetical protein [Mesorhizobium sp.]RWI86583.1 MAG: hypothetical protein EOR20_08100 [Mesorhizobium sp.]RWI99551.1 MAG: hypothetical protein EOR21_02300 [Mesorhizobium sp.]RWJ55603.1 MAG: hypothetical protein EOR30_06785 [Mesorhizobium sp.]RWJ63362.1 MAG: hypothetical protein EOR32_10610 [Mesorhizobium sp.]TIM63666.1 MAG: hypothetical protein E5Y52_21850 [Mesorhizobium sp.]